MSCFLKKIRDPGEINQSPKPTAQVSGGDLPSTFAEAAVDECDEPGVAVTPIFRDDEDRQFNADRLAPWRIC
jgi:hypothetical protein